MEVSGEPAEDGPRSGSGFAQHKTEPVVEVKKKRTRNLLARAALVKRNSPAKDENLLWYDADQTKPASRLLRS